MHFVIHLVYTQANFLLLTLCHIPSITQGLMNIQTHKYKITNSLFNGAEDRVKSQSQACRAPEHAGSQIPLKTRPKFTKGV